MPVLGVSSLNSGRACTALLFCAGRGLRGGGLFGRGLFGCKGPDELHRRQGADLLQQADHQAPGGAEGRELGVARLVHVERSVDFDLQGMAADARSPTTAINPSAVTQRS